MESLPALWPLLGFAAWFWIMARNNMVDGFGDYLLATGMILPFCVGGPFSWFVVALSEYDGRIK